MAFRSHERREVDFGQAQLRLDPPNALSEEKAFDPVDVAGPFADEALALAVRTTRVLLLGRRNAGDRTHMTFAAINGDERAQ
jgi:hypothetical protein